MYNQLKIYSPGHGVKIPMPYTYQNLILERIEFHQFTAFTGYRQCGLTTAMLFQSHKNSKHNKKTLLVVPNYTIINLINNSILYQTMNTDNVVIENGNVSNVEYKFSFNYLSSFDHIIVDGSNLISDSNMRFILSVALSIKQMKITISASGGFSYKDFVYDLHYRSDLFKKSFIRAFLSNTNDKENFHKYLEMNRKNLGEEKFKRDLELR